MATDPAEKALETYTSALYSLEAHLEANKEVFDRHKQFVFGVMEAENDLRDIIAMTRQPVQNDRFEVQVRPMSRTVYDEDAIRRLSSQGIDVSKLIRLEPAPTRVTIVDKLKGIK